MLTWLPCQPDITNMGSSNVTCCRDGRLQVSQNVSGWYGWPIDGFLIAANMLLPNSTAARPQFVRVGSNYSDSGGIAHFNIELHEPAGTYSIVFSAVALTDILGGVPPVVVDVQILPCDCNTTVSGQSHSSTLQCHMCRIMGLSAHRTGQSPCCMAP